MTVLVQQARSTAKTKAFHRPAKTLTDDAALEVNLFTGGINASISAHLLHEPDLVAKPAKSLDPVQPITLIPGRVGSLGIDRADDDVHPRCCRRKRSVNRDFASREEPV